MLSVDAGLNSQVAQIAQTPSSPLGPSAEQEEKKKQSHIPTVEVSVAQAQSISPRVGDFLANPATAKSSNGSGSSNSGLAPTGADGVAPPAAAAIATPPATPSDNGGSSTDGEPRGEQAAFAAAGAEASEAEGRFAVSDRYEQDENAVAIDEDGTYSASQQAPRASSDELPPVPVAAAGSVININQQAEIAAELEDDEAAFAEDERRGEEQEAVEEAEQSRNARRADQPAPQQQTTTVANGTFNLQFDEAGTYGFAAA